MSPRRPTALVTGAAGFLGRATCRELQQDGWRVVSVDLEGAPEAADAHHAMRLPDPRLDEVLAAERIEAVVHCAGGASVAASVADPAADFADGPPVCMALLSSVRRAAPGARVLLISSAAVYGQPATLPVTEGAPLRPLSPYGYHKLMSELVFEQFASVHGILTASARVFSAYGPGLRRQVVYDACERLSSGGDCVFQGTGAETRDFLHARDVATAIRIVLEKGAFRGDRYNVASGTPTRIDRLIQTLSVGLGAKGSIRFEGASRPGNPDHWEADVSKIFALGFRPAIPLEVGLRETIDWFSGRRPR